MSYQTRTREFAIGELLEKCAPLVEAVGRRKWNFILNNGSMLLVTAQANDEWLHLQASLEPKAAADVDAWKLLQLNHQLGLSRFALLPGERGAHLRAEIALDEEVDLARRLHEACAGLKAGAGRLHGEKPAEHEKLSPAITIDAAAPKGGPELQHLCREAGWQFTEKSATRLAVELEAGDGFYQAVIEERPGGEVLVSIEVARDEAFGEWSRRALGAMLLQACGVVRLTRAAIRETGGQATALFEVLFPTMPCAVELGHALSALSLSCRLCGREVAAMQDERVARNYLAAQKYFGKT